VICPENGAGIVRAETSGPDQSAPERAFPGGIPVGLTANRLAARAVIRL
jgi:hypothetical protein